MMTGFQGSDVIDGSKKKQKQKQKRSVKRMVGIGLRKRVAAAALGLGVVATSLLGALQVDAAPQPGAGAQQAAHRSCWCDGRVTTDYLNLRSGPGTDYDVLLVMPEGAEVIVSLAPEDWVNGFARTVYGDVDGYASADYLSEIGSDGEGYPIVGVATTTDDVNFRQGPGTDYYVQSVVPAGSQVDISDEIVDGFRYVHYDGRDGWISNGYLSQDGGGYGQTTMTTTTYLNLREDSSLDAPVIVVMPEGATVYASDLVVNGFRSVVYGSYEGWAYDDYLQ